MVNHHHNHIVIREIINQYIVNSIIVLCDQQPVNPIYRSPEIESCIEISITKKHIVFVRAIGGSARMVGT